MCQDAQGRPNHKRRCLFRSLRYLFFSKKHINPTVIYVGGEVNRAGEEQDIYFPRRNRCRDEGNRRREDGNRWRQERLLLKEDAVGQRQKSLK